jgi:hypothetical protein
MTGVDFCFAFEKGSITMTTAKLTVVSVGDDSKTETRVEEFEPTTGVPEEMAAWADSLETGTENALLSPHEGLGDIEWLESMFESGKQQGSAQALRHQ